MITAFSATDLVQKKRRGEELTYGPKIGPINEFLEHELDHFGGYPIEHEKHFAPVEDLDRIFFSALEAVWGY